MSEDTLPGHQIDPLEARVVVFRQHPESRGFAELRQELREAGRGELLAELCATWAQHERDPVRAADAWSEAGEAMVVLGETATAIEYLRTALDLDPTNDQVPPQRHITVGWGRDYFDVTPVRGVVIGPAAKQTLEVGVDVTAIT